MAYLNKFHLNCGGLLTYAKHVMETVKTKRGLKTLEKDLYMCDKCGQFVNCITFPTYREYKKRDEEREERKNVWR